MDSVIVILGYGWRPRWDEPWEMAPDSIRVEVPAVPRRGDDVDIRHVRGEVGHVEWAVDEVRVFVKQNAPRVVA